MKKITLGLVFLLWNTAPAWAVLGQSVDSVESDRKMLEGRVESVTLPYYSIHQITRDGGMTVKEYVSPKGIVFGVSWQGPTMPNLSQLLGNYYGDFQRAAESRVRRRGPISVRTGDLVVESGGHMRAFHGRAYVLSLVPNTVTKEVVQ